MTTDDRLMQILEALQDIAAGNLARRIEISSRHDELDALSHAVNVVAGELDYTTQRLSRARDEAERANQSKSVFLRNVSHEIRTPLAAILGIAELLATAPELDDTRRAELYARIATNAHAQLDMVDELLDLAKVEAGKLSIELRAVDLAGLIEDVVTNLGSAARDKGLELVVDHRADSLIVGDRRRVRQIIASILGNAIKFADRGRIAVTTRREGRAIVLDVSEATFAEHRLQPLFEPFAQADTSLTDRHGGSGLGLALSRRLARAMGGELSVVDAEGHAMFRLSLPAWDERTDASGPNRRAARSVLDGLRILVVDDHHDIRTLTVMLLQSRGAHVLEAAGGLEAVELGSSQPLDLILMDTRMPDLDGLEATRQLRARGVTMPIIALSADVTSDAQRNYVAAGTTAHFPKPIEIERLVALIRGLPNRAPIAT